MRRALVALVGFLVLAASPAAHATVQLLQIDAITVFTRGASDFRSALVKVADLGSAKRVTLFEEYADGVYRESEPGVYVGPAEPGWELWQINAVRRPLEPELGDELVVKYEVDGQTYCDNNRGRNYKIGTPAQSEGEILFADLNVLQYTAQALSDPGSVTFSGAINVRNLAYQKDVVVRYTTDGWQTYQEIPARFTPVRRILANMTIHYPNRFGVERFEFSGALPENVQRIEYAIRYQVAGQTFWDNNFGHNYALVPHARGAGF